MYCMNILDNFKRILFSFHTFLVRRPLLTLTPRIRSEFYRVWAGFLNPGHQWHLHLTPKV